MYVAIDMVALAWLLVVGEGADRARCPGPPWKEAEYSGSARRCSDLPAQRLERRPHLLDEEVGLFPGGEVTALGSLVVVNQLGISLLRPALRRCVDLVGIGGDGDRDLDPPHVEKPVLLGWWALSQ